MSSNQDTLTAGGLPQDDDVVPAPPCVMVIFGGAGDLTKRLVAPALYNLSRSKRLSDGFQIVGFDLAETTAERSSWLDVTVHGKAPTAAAAEAIVELPDQPPFVPTSVLPEYICSSGSGSVPTGARRTASAISAARANS